MPRPICYSVFLLATISVPALALYGQPGALAAETTGADAQKRQIDSLSDRVRALEREVKQLEQRLSAAPAAAAPSVPARPVAPSFREAWRGIHDRMTQDEVKRRLGEPQREFNLSGNRVWYYYYSGVGGGSVFFNADGRVAGSQPPPRPW